MGGGCSIICLAGEDIAHAVYLRWETDRQQIRNGPPPKRADPKRLVRICDR